jgi:Zn-dependent M28 family amino/carboxypeptidase
MYLKNSILTMLILSALTACNVKEKDISAGLKSISADDLKQNISVLASDDFKGRFPGTDGEKKTIDYIAAQFAKVGLKPANNGSWFQEVPLVRITPSSPIKFSVTGAKGRAELKEYDDFVGSTPLLTGKINFDNSDIVFVGYGINAPEYRWNDYSGLDVRGKTVVMLVNDPGYATGDTTLFNGKAMTYYGRWTYKYEEAARQGARAAVIIHETGAAGYPWEVVRNSFTGPQLDLEQNELSNSSLEFKAWITTDEARKLFEAAGLNYDNTVRIASHRGFIPVDMHLKASVEFSNSVARLTSNNVAGVLPGKTRPDEYIIYTAHWDHLGVNDALKGDSIFNGAVDNATGVAALISIAKAFKSLPFTQERSILFLSVTGEEQGLLGSEYYVSHPLYPLNKTVADINMDALDIFGPTRDMTIIGYGYSSLDNFVVPVLNGYGRYLIPDPEPEKGGYFRSDHFSFAKAGVPSLDLSGGIDDYEVGKELGRQERDQWTMQHYHKPSDEYDPAKWDFEGMVSDIKVYFQVGYDLSMTDQFPDWVDGNPYKPLRDKMMENLPK